MEDVEEKLFVYGYCVSQSFDSYLQAILKIVMK